MPKPKRTHLSLHELETLLHDALVPWVNSETIHEIVYHSSSAFRQAKELLARERLLDGTGELTPAALVMADEIESGRRPAGTPLEDAIVEYFHLKKSSSGSSAIDSLIARGILDEELELTKEGWRFVHTYLDEEKLERIIKAQNDRIFVGEKTPRRSGREVGTFGAVRPNCLRRTSPHPRPSSGTS